ncbi:MAG: hypothetical protein LBH43_10375 [Treponema sp.]|jgi:hypothetical protein|nr:hypothetical protein [Treponema sp.]
MTVPRRNYRPASLRGHGLKLEGDEFHQEQLDVFFKPNNGVPIVDWNSPRLLKVLVPQELIAETEYQIAVETWSSPRGHPGILKKARDMRSRFRLKAVYQIKSGHR